MDTTYTGEIATDGDLVTQRVQGVKLSNDKEVDLNRVNAALAGEDRPMNRAQRRAILSEQLKGFRRQLKKQARIAKRNKLMGKGKKANAV